MYVLPAYVIITIPIVGPCNISPYVCLENHTNSPESLPVYDGERQQYGTSTQTHYISNAGLMLPELAQGRSKCNQINARL